MSARNLRFSPFLASSIVAVLLAGLGSWLWLKDPGMPDKLEYIEKLNAGDFAWLEQRLAGLQEAYEVDHTLEQSVEIAFGAFYHSDPALLARLDQWVADRPDSYAALLARGTYRARLAWLERGENVAAETLPSQFAGMSKQHALASADMHAARAINPRLNVARARILWSVFETDGRAAVRELVEEGLAYDPASFAIRSAYLVTIEPKWGGSLSEIAAFLEQMKPHVETNPRLAGLMGYLAYVKADDLRRQDKRKESNQYVDIALGYGDHQRYWKRRGINNQHLENYQEAIDDLTRALMLQPQTPDILRHRAAAYRMLDDHDAALADIELAVALDPRNPDVLWRYATILNDDGRYEDAVAALNGAFEFGSSEAKIWYLRGKTLLWKLNRAEEAKTDLAEAVRLAPERSHYWYHYGGAMNYTRDCGMIAAFETYLALCADTGDCGNDGVTWAKETLPTFRQFCADKV